MKKLLIISLIVILFFLTYRQINQNKLPTQQTENFYDETIDNDLPKGLIRQFPKTDFAKINPKLVQAISGGPTKDGIPAIDEPKFISIDEFTHPDNIQAVVIQGKEQTKVYPYNILTWHEIVNDTIDDKPIAVTFCPLCGSAIVFNRTLPNGQITTFGVSGFLLESNMIMYDRSTENLWQQSTGKTLAGSFHEAILTLESFQLLTLGEIRQTFPDATILSEDTGYSRDYDRNPYAGYESDNRFVFDPSSLDTTFAPKNIMLVFRDQETTFVADWLELRNKQNTTITHNNLTYTLSVSDDGELTITDNNDINYPFYFEMWFSVAVQNTNQIRIIYP